MILNVFFESEKVVYSFICWNILYIWMCFLYLYKYMYLYRVDIIWWGIYDVLNLYLVYIFVMCVFFL